MFNLTRGICYDGWNGGKISLKLPYSWQFHLERTSKGMSMCFVTYLFAEIPPGGACNLATECVGQSHCTTNRICTCDAGFLTQDQFCSESAFLTIHFVACSMEVRHDMKTYNLPSIHFPVSS